MTFQGDPYRTLGIVPGASLNEIRSAYRRLVKQYHPDAAGERALPRFLAIQAAYERLVDGEGQLRAADPRMSRGGAGAGGGSGGSGEAWRADPARARASRDAWRARRSAGGPGSSARAGPDGAGARRDRTPPPADGTAGPRRRGPAERHARRGPRTATPGSTTYDEAADIPLDPEWDGGAWYGPSSGTFWTINPREYADPRKHGPEYQARARRATGGPDAEPAFEGEPVFDAEPVFEGEPGRGAAPGVGATATGAIPETDVDGDDATWRWSGAQRTSTADAGTDWGARGWTFDPGEPIDARPGPGPRRRSASWPDDATAGDDGAPLPDLETLARRAAPRRLLALARRPDRRWRLLLALAGWPPIGYAVGALLSAATGCATFSAACPEPLPLLPLAAQPFVVAALFLLPPAAAAAAFAAAVALAFALPVAAVLSVGTLQESEVGATILGVVVAVAYVVALVGGAVEAWRDGAEEAGSEA
jgi:hypothetical protein